MLSIIIPCYNHSNKIAKAINSCNLITIDKEIIVINDGSTDDTEVVVKQFSHVKIINQENRGLGNARNTGVLASRYDNILPLDADDEFLIGVNNLFDHIGNYDIIYGNVSNPTGHLHRLLPDTALNNVLFEQQNPMTSVFLFTKNVWLTIHGFSEDRQIYEDWDFVAKAFYRNFKFKHVDTNVFIYHRTATGMLAHKLNQHSLHKQLTLESIKKFKHIN